MNIPTIAAVSVALSESQHQVKLAITTTANLKSAVIDNLAGKADAYLRGEFEALLDKIDTQLRKALL